MASLGKTLAGFGQRCFQRRGAGRVRVWRATTGRKYPFSISEPDREMKECAGSVQVLAQKRPKMYGNQRLKRLDFFGFLQFA
jgi:hypothetical protein